MKIISRNRKLISIKSLDDKIRLIENKCAVINAHIANIKKDIEDIEKRLINDAKVIGTTLSMFHSQTKLYLRKYDVVIIDEVTMAILPQIFFAASNASKKIFIVGDFMQLQPIIREKNSAFVREWLSRDIFSKNGITAGNSPRLNTLRIQRRMHPAIGEIVNQCLYNGILQHLPVDLALENQRPVTFIDTSKFSPYSTVPGDSGRVNIYNAVLAIKVAQSYLDNDQIGAIGIITPYRKQANILSKLVFDTKLNHKVIADTVHKFQGVEKDIIIFDIPDGENSKNYRIGKNLRDDKSSNLFNVAFTRAKKKLVIIGDLNYLREHHNELSPKTQAMFKVLQNLFHLIMKL